MTALEKITIEPVQVLILNATTIAGNTGVEAASWSCLLRKSHDAASQHPAKAGPRSSLWQCPVRRVLRCRARQCQNTLPIPCQAPALPLN